MPTWCMYLCVLIGSVKRGRMTAKHSLQDTTPLTRKTRMQYGSTQNPYRARVTDNWTKNRWLPNRPHTYRRIHTGAYTPACISWQQRGLKMQVQQPLNYALYLSFLLQVNSRSVEQTWAPEEPGHSYIAYNVPVLRAVLELCEWEHNPGSCLHLSLVRSGMWRAWVLSLDKKDHCSTSMNTFPLTHTWLLPYHVHDTPYLYQS